MSNRQGFGTRVGGQLAVDFGNNIGSQVLFSKTWDSPVFGAMMTLLANKVEAVTDSTDSYLLIEIQAYPEEMRANAIDGGWLACNVASLNNGTTGNVTFAAGAGLVVTGIKLNNPAAPARTFLDFGAGDDHPIHMGVFSPTDFDSNANSFASARGVPCWGARLRYVQNTTGPTLGIFDLAMYASAML